MVWYTGGRHLTGLPLGRLGSFWTALLTGSYTEYLSDGAYAEYLRAGSYAEYLSTGAYAEYFNAGSFFVVCCSGSYAEYLSGGSYADCFNAGYHAEYYSSGSYAEYFSSVCQEPLSSVLVALPRTSTAHLQLAVGSLVTLLGLWSIAGGNLCCGTGGVCFLSSSAGM